MSSQLDNLQTKADDIGNVVTLSLGQQKQLLDGQSLALEGLDTLTQSQVEAFEQSRWDFMSRNLQVSFCFAGQIVYMFISNMENIN